MTVRVRYRANDLSEGVVEEIPWANNWEVAEDNTLYLLDVFIDDETEKRVKRKVGVVHQERWDSVCLVEEEETAE